MQNLTHLMRSFGFTEQEVMVYLTALKSGPQTVLELSRLTGLSRQSIYDAIDGLTGRELMTELVQGKKKFSVAQPPEKLLAYIKQHQLRIAERVNAIEALIPDLQATYNLSTDRPIVRFFEGEAGLRKMYEEKLASGARESYFIRTSRADIYRETLGPWFREYMRRQVEQGMRTHALTVDDAETNHDPAFDAARRMTRTWLRPEDYTAPIQIDAYGERVAILSFGKEIFGIIIESLPFATAIREILRLAEKGAKTVEIKHDHPPVTWVAKA